MATNNPRALQVYDPVLSNLARNYRPDGLIARDLLPSIPTKTLSAQYPTFPKAYWFQLLADNKVANRTAAKEVDFTWSMENYLCEEYALKASIDELQKLQAIPQLKLEAQKARHLANQMELSYEIRVAETLMPAGTQGNLEIGQLTAANTHTPATAWDNSGNPEVDLKQASIATYRLTGRRPNVVIIPFEVAYALAVNATFRALIKYDATGKPINAIEVGDKVLPSTIHGMRVIIPEGAQFIAGNEAAADSAALTEIWGKHVRCLWVNPKSEWGDPTVAYRVEHTPKRVTKWSTVDPDVDYVREQERFDIITPAPDLGYVIKDVIS